MLLFNLKKFKKKPKFDIEIYLVFTYILPDISNIPLVLHIFPGYTPLLVYILGSKEFNLVRCIFIAHMVMINHVQYIIS